jgi:hypothetical protein
VCEDRPVVRDAEREHEVDTRVSAVRRERRERPGSVPDDERRRRRDHRSRAGIPRRSSRPDPPASLGTIERDEDRPGGSSAGGRDRETEIANHSDDEQADQRIGLDDER